VAAAVRAADIAGHSYANLTDNSSMALVETVMISSIVAIGNRGAMD
jgi:hypothetical protein